MRTLAALALTVALAGCSAERLTGTAAQDAVRQHQAMDVAPRDLPLMLLDGKEISEADARALDAATISSVEVLKGAAAAKLYGERGARGVVLITSRSASR